MGKVARCVDEFSMATTTQPSVLEGELMLGRSSGAAVDMDDFTHLRILQTLTAEKTKKAVRQVQQTDRTPTKLDDIVRAVLSVTHREVYDSGNIEAVHRMHGIIDSYVAQSVDLRGDKGLIEAIEDRLDGYANTDLIRGMNAFADAEFDRYQGMYEHTIIRPATRLAAWMITMEQDPNFVD